MTTFLNLKYHLILTHQAVFFFSPAFQFIIAILQNIFLNLEIFELPRSSVNHNFNNDQYLQTVEDLSLWILGYIVIISRGWMAHNSMHFFAHFFFEAQSDWEYLCLSHLQVDGSSPEPINLGFSLL